MVLPIWMMTPTSSQVAGMPGGLLADMAKMDGGKIFPASIEGDLHMAVEHFWTMMVTE